MAAALLQDAAGPSALRINNFIHFAQMTLGYQVSEGGPQDTQQRCSEYHLL